MAFVSCITLLLLFSTVTLADYYIDNADTSVVYSMPSNQSWLTLSEGTSYQYLRLINSTGNHTIALDSSNCYDQNYAEGGCRTADSCFVQIPFTGSGITMYVFNAGLSGMTAGFSVDSGAAVSSSIAAPTAAENYQVSNVSLYDVQGLPSGNHTIKMTLMDWEGTTTYMKFDYALVNESFVAVPPSTTSTASASNRIGVPVGGIVGIVLGVVAILGGIVIGIICFRKRRRASHRGNSSSAPEPTYQIEPLTSEYLRSITPSSRPHAHDSSFQSLRSDENSAVTPLMPPAILRNAHAAGSFSPPIPVEKRSITSGAIVLQPPSQHSADNNPFGSSSISHIAHEGSAFSDPSTIGSRYNLTAAQVETVCGLVADRVPADTIARVIEAFVSSRFSTHEANAGQVISSSEHAWSLESPPSYQTWAR